MDKIQYRSRYVSLPEKHIVFGIYYDLRMFKQVNYIILLAKWFIHRQKQASKSVDLYAFLPVLKYHLELERYISVCNGKMNVFGKQWGKIYDNL